MFNDVQDLTEIVSACYQVIKLFQVRQLREEQVPEMSLEQRLICPVTRGLEDLLVDLLICEHHVTVHF